MQNHRSVFYTSLAVYSKYAMLIHQENMSVKCMPPYTPLLYSKAGVCRGIPNFLIFDLKHRLWVHRGGSNKYPQSMFWIKNKKNMFILMNHRFS